MNFSEQYPELSQWLTYGGLLSVRPAQVQSKELNTKVKFVLLAGRLFQIQLMIPLLWRPNLKSNEPTKAQ